MRPAFHRRLRFGTSIAAVALGLALCGSAHAASTPPPSDGDPQNEPLPDSIAPRLHEGLSKAASSADSSASSTTAPVVPSIGAPPAPISKSALPKRGRTIPLSIVPRTNTGRRLTWDPAWRRVDWSDVALAASAGAVTLASAIVKPLNYGRPWQGGILFDEQA
ncbi:MAG: hypothetical protein ABI461_21020, partial [Polyangiaceae bacterium]